MYSVILPALNEQGSIGKVVRELLEDEQCFVIVADDGSTDGTKEEVGKFGRRVFFLDRGNEKEHGLCISVLHALQFAKGDYVVVMDADGQHPPKKAREIARALEEGADFAVGARQDWESMKIHRKIISLGATAIAGASLRLRGRKTVRDPMSGFFGVRLPLALAIAKKGKFAGSGYKVLFEMLKYAPKEANVAQVFFEMGKREKGESKIGWKHVAYFLQAAIF